MNRIYLIELSKKYTTEEYRILTKYLSQNFTFDFLLENSKNISSLIGKLTVCIKACEKLGIERSNLFFSLGENGKPYLNAYPNFHFNISHSENLVAVAFSDYPIGIDAEKIRVPNFKVAKRFFADNEINYIGNDSRRFFEIWTKKEAYLKYKGLGLSFPISNFDITDSSLSSKIISFEKNNFLISIYSDIKKNKILEFSEIDILNKYINWS